MSVYRGTIPRMSGMLRHPSQPSSIAGALATISGLMITAAGLCASGSSSRSATNSRSPSCTCGPARPTPWYSCIVSIMSSISFWTAALLMSDLSSGFARSRRTGWPMRATFRMDMKEDYTVFNEVIRFCPRCAGALESRLLKATEPPLLVCGSCSFVYYLDPKFAVGAIIADGAGRIVLEKRAIEPGYGKWVFPGGFIDRGETVEDAAIREAREECGLDIRLDRLVNIYSYPGVAVIIIAFAATVVGGCLGCDDESLEAQLFDPARIPWEELAFRSTKEALEDFLVRRT